jgi:hypothetical protein
LLGVVRALATQTTVEGQAGAEHRTLFSGDFKLWSKRRIWLSPVGLMPNWATWLKMLWSRSLRSDIASRQGLRSTEVSRPLWLMLFGFVLFFVAVVATAWVSIEQQRSSRAVRRGLEIENQLNRVLALATPQRPGSAIPADGPREPSIEWQLAAVPIDVVTSHHIWSAAEHVS